VLCTPFVDQEVVHAVRSAWESWQRQWGRSKPVSGRRAAAVAAREHLGNRHKTA
jgi:hypothetical protein